MSRPCRINRACPKCVAADVRRRTERRFPPKNPPPLVGGYANSTLSGKALTIPIFIRQARATALLGCREEQALPHANRARLLSNGADLCIVARWKLSRN